MKQALLCVSFGTSVPSARQSIDAVETALHGAAPDLDLFRAFTSPTIRKILAGQGEYVPSLSQALDMLCDQSYQRVIVQPTHILTGIEYDKILDEIKAAEPRFEMLKLGQPLLADRHDMETLAEALAGSYPSQAGEALVLMGHGTTHTANEVYPQMQKLFNRIGREDILVGTVEGFPALDNIRTLLHTREYHTVHLVPLMLVAGDHAFNDMAGDQKNSWKNVLEQDGFRVRCTLQGLGILPQIQKMYIEHLHDVFPG